MKKWNLKTWQIIMAPVILLLLIIMIVAMVKGRGSEEEPIEEYAYTVKEQVLADEVIVYLQNAAGLGEASSAKTANEAVESYRLILKSDVDMVNEDHTQAIQDRISKVLTGYVGKDAALLEKDIPALSAGVAEIVWRSILSQIESVTEDVEESDYFYLAESMQQQINELEERKMKVSIRANINKDTDLTGMSDEEIEALAKSLGLSLDELYQLLEEGTDIIGNKELEELLAKLKKELEEKLDKEIANGKNGSNGTSASGSASKGMDGKNGENGKDGKDGKDGAAGKSVFIRYAENSNGTGMTESPTTNTKFMGTYSGTEASTNPSDYTWTRYSDATITYSDGTLYITQ